MTFSPPRFLSSAIAMAVHDRQLAEHGGAVGVKDAGLLESAMARPINKMGMAKRIVARWPLPMRMASRNHPFVDGNKRTAWVIARLFLKLNDVEIRFDKVDAIPVMLALAAGDLSEDALADWFRAHVATEART